MSLRTELLDVMRTVDEADPRSPYAVAQTGIECFDFIARRGKSLIAVIDTMDRMHRELYMRREQEAPATPSRSSKGVRMTRALARPIRKGMLRQAAPEHISVREELRRHLHESGQQVQALAAAWGCKPFSVWRMFQRAGRPLSPRHIEAAISALELDNLDANDLRLRAAREAGWAIDPQYLLEERHGID